MRSPPHPTHPLASEQPRTYLAPSLAPSLPTLPPNTAHQAYLPYISLHIIGALFIR